MLDFRLIHALIDAIENFLNFQFYVRFSPAFTGVASCHEEECFQFYVRFSMELVRMERYNFSTFNSMLDFHLP